MHTTTTPERAHSCLACGLELAPVLTESGSLRCHDCRDDDVPLRRELVTRMRMNNAGLRLIVSPPAIVLPSTEHPLAA